RSLSHFLISSFSHFHIPFAVRRLPNLRLVEVKTKTCFLFLLPFQCEAGYYFLQEIPDRVIDRVLCLAPGWYQSWYEIPRIQFWLIQMVRCHCRNLLHRSLHAYQVVGLQSPPVRREL